VKSSKCATEWASPACEEHFYALHLLRRIKQKDMNAIYQISSEVTGTVLIRRRKNAKALRQWLRENGIKYEYSYYFEGIH
jgi:hypothetical protein